MTAPDVEPAGLARRPLGRGGPAVPVLAFGCGPSARLMVGDDTALQARCVHTAIEAGMTLFDTAAAYGDGRSERSLGQALAGTDAPVQICSKVLLGPDELGDIRGAVLRSVTTSLRRLGRDRLDVLLLHNRVAWRRDPSRSVGIGPLLSVDDVLGPYAEALADLQADALVGAAGFTAFGGDADAIDELAAAGVFVTANVDFGPGNLSAGHSVPVPGEPDYRSVVDRLAAHGLGAMAIRIFGNGRLFGPHPARTPRDTRVAQWLQQTAGGVVAGAVRTVLAKPGVSTAVVGVSAPEHVLQAVAAARRGPLPAPLLRDLRLLHTDAAGTADTGTADALGTEVARCA